jgi:hypothetical protein
MSVRSATGHYFAQSISPASLTNWTQFGIAKPNSDLGASVQLLSAMTFDGGDGTATASYWDATANDMLGLSLDAGTPISGGVATLGSRPPVGTWFAWYLSTNGTTTTLGWYNLDTPTAWVNASCTALNAQIATLNAIEITSNSNPFDSDHEVWRAMDGTTTEAAILADLATNDSSIANLFDFHMIAVGNVVEKSGSGATIVSQGGTLSTGDTYNFPPTGPIRIITPVMGLRQMVAAR